jgi:hypothetical protein
MDAEDVDRLDLKVGLLQLWDDDMDQERILAKYQEMYRLC